MKRRHRWYLLLVLSLLPACSPAYVLRAGYEEAKILWRRQPITEVLSRPDIDAKTRSKLELVLSVRRFAEQIGLRVGGSYSSFSHVDGNQVVYVLSAAQPLRLEPYTWWFPIVGRVPYKGFFDKEVARSEASKLQEHGLDTVIFPSVAFSTLGWFDDPLLSNLLRHDRVVLASIVLHELCHNTFYAPGQGAFNETLADFVGDRGAVAYFSTHEGPQAPSTQRAEMLWEDARTFSAFMDDFVDRLRGAYEAGMTLDQRSAFFRDAQAQFKQLHFHTDMHSDFGSMKLNNAVILHERMYYKDLNMFEEVYARDHDLATAIHQIIAAAKGAAEPFAAVRKSLGIPEAPSAEMHVRNDGLHFATQR